MTILEFGILTTAIQYLIGASSLSFPVRNMVLTPIFVRKGLECAPCAGTWIGVILQYALHQPYEYSLDGFIRAGAAGMVLTAIGRSLMSLGVIEETK